MDKFKNKKAFTLVEIVIVIAVIGILAGVAIPTFSGVFKSINKKADIELANEMTSALESHEHLYGNIYGIKAAMQALNLAGYQNWNCKGDNNKLYWYSIENIMVLVNTEEVDGETVNTVLYPEDTAPAYKLKFDEPATRVNFFEFDQENKESDAMDFSITMSTQTVTYTAEALATKLGISAAEANYIFNHFSIANTLAVGEQWTLPEGKTEGARATAQSFGIGPLQSDKPPYIYLSVPSGLENDETSQKYAARLLCAIIHQIDTGKISSDVKIFIKAGLTLDCAELEWSQIKDEVFTGYIGSLLANSPATIKNLTLTSATSYKDLTCFSTGTKSSDYYYSFAGFISAIGGNAEIANLRFTNLSIDEPGQDCDIQRADNGPRNLRNSVGLIGAAVSGSPILSNIVVDEKISGTSVVGGLVGYVGNMVKDTGSETGDLVNLTIKNCIVNADLASSDYLSDSYCGSVGGFIGLVDRYGSTRNVLVSFTNEVAVDLKNTYSGSTSGFRRIGGVVGNVMVGTITFADSLSAEEADLNIKHSATTVSGLACVHSIESLVFAEGTYYLDQSEDPSVNKSSIRTSESDKIAAVIEVFIKNNEVTTNKYELGLDTTVSPVKTKLQDFTSK